MSHYDEKQKRTVFIFIACFLFLVMGIVTSGYVSYRNFEREFRRQAENQISAIAELKVNELVNWRRERLGDAQSFYNNPVFSGLVLRYFENPDDVEARTQLLSHLEYYQSYYQFKQVCLLDETGNPRLSTSTIAGVSDTKEEYLAAFAAESLRSGEILFLDFQTDPNADGEIRIPILTPIYDVQNNNRPLGVLVLKIDPETYLYPYIIKWPIPSNTAETLLVRRDGEHVVFLNDLRYKQNAALNLRYPLTETDIPAVNAVLGQTGIVAGVDYRGEAVLADVRPVPNSPWFLVSKMDTAEVYAPLQARLWQTLLIITLAVFVAGTGLVVVWRQQRIFFYRTQLEGADALRASEEKFRKAFILSPDSININRLQDGTYISINNGFTKVMGYAADEVVGKTSLELNIWADPQDRKALVDGLMKNGEVQNLDARFRARNGDIKYGLMSASRLDLNGTPHIISITRDITERKLEQEALLASEERFRTLYDNSTIGLYRTAPDGRILMLNPTGIRMLGFDSFDEIVQRNLENTGFETEHPRSEFRKKLESEGAVVGFESSWKRKDGSSIFVRENAKSLRDEDGKILYYDGSFEDITERKLAEEALKENEAIFSSFLEHSPVYVFFKDKNIRSLRLSKNYEQMLGLPISDLLGKTMYDLFPSDLAKNMVADDLQILKDARRITVVEEFNGRVFETTKFPVLKDGAPAMLAGFSLDITERIQAEEALRVTLAKYKTLFEYFPLGISVADEAGNILETNPIAEKLLAVSGEEHIQRGIDSLKWRIVRTDGTPMPPDEFASVRALREKRVVENLEMGVVKPDNTIVWLSVTAAPLPVEEHGIVITYGDITARKKMEKALRESEEHYRTVVSNTPVVTFVTDEKGIFTLSEGKGLAKLGLQPGQVVGLSVFDVYHDYPTIMETMKNALAGYSQREEVEVNGIIFDVFFTPVLDHHGKVVKVIGVSNDITERKQAENQIVKLNQELEQRVRERTLQLETTNKELEAFSYSVSHDLRAPLRGIDGWSQALLEDYHDQLDEQGREYIDRVRSETQRMGYLIDDMLRLSRLTRVEMVKNNVDLSTLAQTIADRLKHDEPQRQVDFTIPAGLIAQGDPHLLEAVLVNLLGNAFKFTGKRVDARIEFGETEMQNQRVFFVRDNGTGFDMAYAQKLFGAFQRMHKLSEFPGTGVGLAIVQRIVNRHGGRVWAEAEIDHGAAFYFTLG